MAVRRQRGQWVCEFVHNSKAHRYVLEGADTREDALAAEAIIRDEVKGGPKTSETVQEWSIRWLHDRSARGLVSVADDLGRLRNHIWPLVGKLKMQSVSKDVLEGLVEELDKKVQDGVLSWKTARNAWGTVSKLCTDAASSKTRALRVLATNPAFGIVGPDGGATKQKEFLFPSEFMALWQCAAIPERRRHLYAVAGYSYLRAGELTALRREDMDTRRRIINVTKARNRKTGEIETTKTELCRRVPMEKTLVPLVERMNWEGYLWAPPDEDRAELLRKDLQRANVTRSSLHETTKTQLRLTFHDLRATGITWRVVRGDDPMKIQHAAGHANFTTTQKYIRLAEVFEQETFGEVFPTLV